MLAMAFFTARADGSGYRFTIAFRTASRHVAHLRGQGEGIFHGVELDADARVVDMVRRHARTDGLTSFAISFDFRELFTMVVILYRKVGCVQEKKCA